MAPSQLELVHFSDEVEQVSNSMSQLEQRLNQLEEKNVSR
ncbi:Uncharacterized protein conserved in bacteria [Providencia alcalifaciens]|nr:Uncharacterized protein conserved in bacteria [Providencia alcalifaciens]